MELASAVSTFPYATDAEQRMISVALFTKV
jgi:hypothetical protein